MEDGACAEEADAGDDLSGDAAGVAGGGGEEIGSHGVDGGAEADEDERAEAGGFVMAFAFGADDGSGEEGGEGEGDFQVGRREGAAQAGGHP